MNAHLGSCLCGEVKYEVIGDFESFFLCHCKHCQKDTGSAFASNLFSSTAKLNWIKGADKVKTYNLPSTRHVKSFCETCSSALPNIQDNGKFVLVPVGSLDTEITIKPSAQIFMRSKASWNGDITAIPSFETFPS